MDAGNDARRWGPALFFVAVFALSLHPIRSYDYFWHLATGRWIVEHQALPLHDPFALASDRVPWINGEWLFDVPLYMVWHVSGHLGVIVLFAALTAALFTWMFRRLSIETNALVAALGVLICWTQASHRIDARPETAAVLLLPVTVAILRGMPTPRRTLLAGLVGVVWINVHPSALLLPVIAFCFLVEDVVARRTEYRRLQGRFAQVVVVSAALLVNPWGLEAILAPLRLARFLQASGVVNLEWVSTSPTRFPLVYLLIVFAFAALLSSRDRRSHAGSLLILGLLSVLAIRFVRNHGFLFAAMPLLVAPGIPRLMGPKIRGWIVAALVGGVAVGLVGLPSFGLGPSETSFPMRAVARLEKLGLRGHIYNPDQFGGYLIWTFYPERRVLTDGRNELYRTFLADYDEARLDSRKWNAMIARHDLVLAVDEYRRRPMEMIDAVTGRKQQLPASLVYFPRERWALVAWDDVGMVFARRDAFGSQSIAEHEFRSLVPDATDPDSVALGDPAAALAELRSTIGSRAPSMREALLLGLLRARTAAPTTPAPNSPLD